jgi:hypothetical protein
MKNSNEEASPIVKDAIEMLQYNADDMVLGIIERNSYKLRNFFSNNTVATEDFLSDLNNYVLSSDISAEAIINEIKSQITHSKEYFIKEVKEILSGEINKEDLKLLVEASIKYNVMDKKHIGLLVEAAHKLKVRIVDDILSPILQSMEPGKEDKQKHTLGEVKNYFMDADKLQTIGKVGNYFIDAYKQQSIEKEKAGSVKNVGKLQSIEKEKADSVKNVGKLTKVWNAFKELVYEVFKKQDQKYNINQGVKEARNLIDQAHSSPSHTTTGKTKIAAKGSRRGV